MGGFGLLVQLPREGSAPAACAAGLFFCSCQNQYFMKIFLYLPWLALYRNMFIESTSRHSFNTLFSTGVWGVLTLHLTPNTPHPTSISHTLHCGCISHRISQEMWRILEQYESVCSEYSDIRIYLNIYWQIYSFIQLFVDFSEANIFRHSFSWIYSDIHSEY